MNKCVQTTDVLLPDSRVLSFCMECVDSSGRKVREVSDSLEDLHEGRLVSIFYRDRAVAKGDGGIPLENVWIPNDHKHCGASDILDLTNAEINPENPPDWFESWANE